MDSVEPDIRVLQTLRDAPTTYFGWAVSDLGDTSHRGGARALIGDPAGSGSSSGAGDVNRDGRADLLVGAPGGLHATHRTGRAYLFSGRTGALLRVLSSGAGGRPGAAYVFPGRDGRLVGTIAAGPRGRRHQPRRRDRHRCRALHLERGPLRRSCRAAVRPRRSSAAHHHEQQCWRGLRLRCSGDRWRQQRRPARPTRLGRIGCLGVRHRRGVQAIGLAAPQRRI
jgi:FG-GAP repeat